MPHQSRRASPLLSQTIRIVRYKIAAPYVRGRVLDVGCGAAYLLDFAPALTDYVGLDIDPRYVALAQQRHPRYAFYQANLDGQPVPARLRNQRFDTITLFAVLEHLAQPADTLAALAALLMPGGCVVATTPTPLGHRVHHWGSLVGLFNYEAVDDHKSILDEHLLAQQMHAAGLHLTTYRPFELGCNQLVVGTAPAAPTSQ